MKRQRCSLTLCLALSGWVLLLSACGTASPTPSTHTPTLQPFTSTATLLPTATPLPSPTPEPLAALVNGEPVTLAELEAELARFQAARQALPDAPLAPGLELATEADMRLFVLNELIDERLLCQAAYANGFILSQETLQTRQDALSAELGGASALEAWMQANQYDLAGFQAALSRSIAAAWMRDQLLASMPTTADQVHARQILLYNQEQADLVLEQLRSGQDFAALAYRYDPVAGGDLGWFPRGYLLEPALEEAAFQLEPGAYSQVIDTQLGYHLLYVIARETDYPLEPDALRVLQQQGLQTWLQDQRNSAQIQIFLP